MAALTKTEIVQRALLSLGQAYTESNVDTDSSLNANQYRIAYDTALDEALALYAPWNMFKKFEPLSRLASYNLPPCWSYAYQIPPQAMQIIRAYPSGGCYTSDYDIYADVIVSKVNALNIEYIFRPQPHQMKPVFYTYFYLQIAYLLGPAYAKNESLYNDVKSKVKMARANAMAKDAQQQTQKSIKSAPLIDARFYGNGRWGG